MSNNDSSTATAADLQSFPMNGGDGPNSYLNNSSLQVLSPLLQLFLLSPWLEIPSSLTSSSMNFTADICFPETSSKRVEIYG